MNTIKVEVDPQSNKISVWNNGKGIPVQIHKEEKIYIPEMIFGKSLNLFSDNSGQAICSRQVTTTMTRRK